MNNTREDIILNYLIGVLSKDEARAFENELEVDKEMNRLYEEYRELYTLTGQVTYEISEVDPNTMRERLGIKTKLHNLKRHLELAGLRWLQASYYSQC